MFSTILQLLDWTKGYHKRIYLGVVCSICQTCSTAIPIIATAYLINEMIKNERGITQLNTLTIYQVTSVIILSVCLRFLFSYKKACLQESIGTEICAKERIEIGDILKRVSLGYFNERKTGEILDTVTNDLSQLELQATKMIDAVMNGYANLLAIIICMMIFCYQAAFIAIGGSLLSLFLLEKMNSYSNRMVPITNKATDQLSSAILEYIKGMQVVKSYGKQGAAINNFQKACSKSKKIHIKINQDFTPGNCLHMLLLKWTSVAIIYVATLFCYQGSLSISYFILISMFIFMIFSGIESLIDASHILGVLKQALIKLEQIKEIDYIDETGHDIDLLHFDIDFHHVSFAYNDANVLENISFHIPEHSSTAIVGPSGSGKSTICSLIARFYDVKQGSIEIGGHDVKELTCDSLLKHISMVFQNVYLFKDTIYNNIKFSNPQATKDEIIFAAKNAQCHDFIMSLPQGYETVIGEGGSSLSGGEKQRISIARAILKDAPIIILDEATASVDPENEQLIQQAISHLVKGKTVITIAHRLATIENADLILVIDQGKLVQEGTHKKLIGEKGLYKQFIDIREKSEGWKI